MITHTRLFKELIQQRKAKTLAELKMLMKLDWLSQKNYVIVNTLELFEWALEKINTARFLAVDTETTGLNICNLEDGNPLKDHMVGMSITWERDQGIYIPFDHELFDNLDKKFVLTQLMPYLETKSIITHNGLFDGKVFYDEGIRLNITQDTMLMYFNLDSTVSKGSKGLKGLTTRRYGYEVIELGDIFEKESDAGLFRYVEYELVKAYACADSDHTFMLFMDTFKELLPGQIKSYRLDIRVQNELVRSEYLGKGIDMKLLEELHEVNSRDMETVESIIYKYVGTTIARKHGNMTSNTLYRFNISSSKELGNVLFNLLGFEIPDELKDSENISVDKFTLNALLKDTTTDRDAVFEELVPKDIMSSVVKFKYPWSQKKDSVLIEKKELKDTACKVAAFVIKYRKLEKLRSSFFAPLNDNNFEGKYFSSIRMTRTETARLVDFLQTLDKYMKKLIIPVKLATDKQYLIDWDQAQIEYRVMVGEAHVESVVEKLNHSEADYHREGGSLVLGKAAEDITNEERGNLKPVNFGIPYGMSEYGILQSQHGIVSDKQERETLLDGIRNMLVLWDEGLHPIKVMLDNYRKKAITPVDDETLPLHLKGKKVGRIANALGRTRIFLLDKLSPQKISSIGRQAGNYPIQSFAREVFCNSFCDFCDACKANGLMDVKVPDSTKATGFSFKNYITIMAYIHDECLMAIDSVVNHEFIYKLIYENCMIKLEGYPRFFCGINVIDNWYEGKDDKFEAPVGYIEEVIKSNPPIFCDPDTNHKEVALKGITDYMIRRITKELNSIDPRTAQGYFDMPYLIPRFKNYFVKPKIASYIGLHTGVPKGASPDKFSEISIESYALYMFKESKILTSTGQAVTLVREGDGYTPKVEKTFFVNERETIEHTRWLESVQTVEQNSVAETDAVEKELYTIDKEVIQILTQQFKPTQEIDWAFKGE